MKKLLLTTTALILITSPALAEETWTQKLGKLLGGEDVYTQEEIDAMNADDSQDYNTEDYDTDDWSDDDLDVSGPAPLETKGTMGLNTDETYSDIDIDNVNLPTRLDNGLEAPTPRFDFEEDENGNAEGVKLDIGGWFKGYGIFVDQDEAGVNEFDFRRDSEIHLNFETTLENGLTVGYHFEMDTLDDAGENDSDESYLYFFGDWGTVNLGAEEGAGDILQVAAPSADPDIDGVDVKFALVNRAGTFDAPIEYEFSAAGKADKVTYISPKVAGFSVGASWAGDSQQDEVDSGLAGQAPDESGSPAGRRHDIFETAAHYVADITDSGDVLTFGGGFAHGQQSDASADSSDFDMWNTALRYAGEFGAIRVAAGVSYGERDNFRGLGEETDLLGVGVSADINGPLSFGASYYNAETEIGGAKDEIDRYSAGLRYKVGPGLEWRSSLHYIELDDNVAAGDNDAFVIANGFNLSF